MYSKGNLKGINWGINDDNRADAAWQASAGLFPNAGRRVAEPAPKLTPPTVEDARRLAAQNVAAGRAMSFKLPNAIQAVQRGRAAAREISDLTVDGLAEAIGSMDAQKLDMLEQEITARRAREIADQATGGKEGTTNA